jgi:hypothetical protein
LRELKEFAYKSGLFCGVAISFSSILSCSLSSCRTDLLAAEHELLSPV